jgi:glycerophosphoryl diester phosphodiesterase
MQRPSLSIFGSNALLSLRMIAYSTASQDVHITSDDVIIMFHDPSLERTTDGKGLIHNQAWQDGIEHLRTVKEPRQQIPTFQQVCDLLMVPENQHVKLNVSTPSRK